MMSEDDKTPPPSAAEKSGTGTEGRKDAAPRDAGAPAGAAQPTTAQPTPDPAKPAAPSEPPKAATPTESPKVPSTPPKASPVPAAGKGAGAEKPRDAAARPPGTDAARTSAGGPGTAPRPQATPGAGTSPPAKRRALPFWVWVLAFIAIIFGAGYLTRTYWSGPVAEYVRGLLPPSQTDTRIATVDARLADAEKKLEALRRDVAGAPDAARAEAAALRQKIDTLTSRLQSLEGGVTALRDAPPSGVSGVAADPRVGELAQRLAQLEQQAPRLGDLGRRLGDVEESLKATAEAGAGALVLTLDRLIDALHTRRPFAAELDAVKKAAAGDPALVEAVSRIEAYVDRGIPTFAELATRFPDAAKAITKAEATMESRDWLDDALNNLRGLVAVRKTGETAISAGGVHAAIALAEHDLAAGDLKGAVAALETLPPKIASAASGWIADARARIGADDAIAKLHLRAIAALQDKKG